MKNGKSRLLWIMIGIITLLFIIMLILQLKRENKTIEETLMSESLNLDTQIVKEETETMEEELTLPGKDGIFTLYFSGIDVFGDVSAKSRSDVNILAVVNMNTNRILLVSTPRDYYVPLSISNGEYDKLTHAGIYGIDCSVDTLELLYGVDINYFFRVNFSGFENIIDSLGGIRVWSDNDFTVDPIKHYVQGYNELNGIETLAFVRERHALANGDNGRGINQMNVIKAVIDKVTAYEETSSYTSLLDSLQGNFETSMSYDEITSLAKKQLKDNTKWEIETYSVTGTGDTRFTYSMSGKATYVMVPNQESVEEAKIKMNAYLTEGKNSNTTTE